MALAIVRAVAEGGGEFICASLREFDIAPRLYVSRPKQSACSAVPWSHGWLGATGHLSAIAYNFALCQSSRTQPLAHGQRAVGRTTRGVHPPPQHGPWTQPFTPPSRKRDKNLVGLEPTVDAMSLSAVGVTSRAFTLIARTIDNIVIICFSKRSLTNHSQYLLAL